MFREPLIYDLWGDIRLWWKIADYYENKLKAVDAFKGSIKFAPSCGERKITLVSYQLRVQ